MSSKNNNFQSTPEIDASDAEFEKNNSPEDVAIARAAREVANQNGYADVNEMFNNAAMQSRSANPRITQNINDFVKGTIYQMVLLVLKQTVFQPSLDASYLSIFDGKIQTQHMSEGNSATYSGIFDTGTATFDKNKWVPDGYTKMFVTQKVISFLSAVGTDGAETLAPGSYEFFKEIAFNTINWSLVFMNGNVSKTIKKYVSQLSRAYKIYLFNQIAGLVAYGAGSSDTDTTKLGKVVSSTKTNLYDAMIELFGYLTKMTWLNADYTIDQAQTLMTTCEKSDIHLFVSANVYNVLHSGILTQLFNTQFFGTQGSIINPENIHMLGQKIVQGDANTTLSNGDEWIGDNVIIAMDLKSIVHTTWYDGSRSQDWATNHSSYHNRLVRGNVSLLPWGKKLTFKFPSVPATTSVTQLTESNS